MKRIAGMTSLAAAALAGCRDEQSALAPAGDNAAMVFDLGVAMTLGAVGVTGLVATLLWFAIRRAAPLSRPARRGMIVGLGVVLPAVALSVLLVYGIVLDRRSAAREADAAMTVRVTGEQWWWRVEYLAADRTILFATANEIRMPVGQPVRFELLSPDVIHSFWVPALGGKLDMIPGRTNRVTLLAERPGTYRGQCAEFCGTQHALMAFMAVAEAPDDFNAWLAVQQTEAIVPAGTEETAGRDVFIATGCGACHTIRGIAASGTIGPDLTHVGSRLTLAAGTLPNHAGTLAGWIADAQEIKPGARMPSFDALTGTELRALAAYLVSLR